MMTSLGEAVYTAKTLVKEQLAYNKITEYISVSSYIEYDHTYIHHVSTSFCDEPAEFAKNGPWWVVNVLTGWRRYYFT